MPRQIKGWKHLEHFTDEFEFYKWTRRYIATYGKSNIKFITNMYMGHWYADVYLKEETKKVKR